MIIDFAMLEQIQTKKEKMLKIVIIYNSKRACLTCLTNLKLLSCNQTPPVKECLVNTTDKLISLA